MRVEPRVAFFTDSFLEVNSVAHTSRQLAEYTKCCAIPFLIVHAAMISLLVILLTMYTTVTERTMNDLALPV